MMTSVAQILSECNINKNMNEIKTLLNSIVDGDRSSADAAFQNIMRDKVRIETDIRRIETAKNIYDNAQKQPS